MFCTRAMIAVVALTTVGLAVGSPVMAAPLRGDYLETRTCDIYTGPCFANSQMGLTGQEALMAWSIREGTHAGVDLTGLKVVLAVRASDTLGYGVGLDVRPEPIRLLVMVDREATSQQREALVDFARTFAGQVAGEVVRVDSVAIEMNVDHQKLAGTLKAGDAVQVVTRKISSRDCRCTNELIYYPPLAATKSYQPAVTQEGNFQGRGLGSQWSNPETASAFVGTFEY